MAYERSVISDSASDRPCSFEQNDQKIQDPIWSRLIPLLILQAGAAIPQKNQVLTPAPVVNLSQQSSY